VKVLEKHKEKLIDKAPVTQLALLSKNIKCEAPEKIRIELYNGKENPTPIWFNEYLVNDTESEPIQAIQSEFKGFGEADINRMVDDRIRSQKRLEEYESLKDEVSDLRIELEEQRDLVAELENENEELKQKLEGKKQIRYYAGMLGDIFESFGIAKEKVKNPIVQLMGLSESDEETESGKDKETSQTQNTEDEEPDFKPKGNSRSGAEQSKREEIITLISDYLQSSENKTLAEVFAIFSEIEHCPILAGEILAFIETKKQLKTEV